MSRDKLAYAVDPEIFARVKRLFKNCGTSSSSQQGDGAGTLYKWVSMPHITISMYNSSIIMLFETCKGISYWGKGTVVLTERKFLIPEM